MKMKIVVLERLAISDDELRAIAKPITDMGHELALYEKTDDLEKQKEYVKDADILVVGNMPLKGEVIRAAKNLKYIPVAFTGYDHVDLEACKERDIKVSNASGYATINVAELVIGMMINLLRQITTLDKSVRDGGLASIGQDLTGKTVGVLGTGVIGYKTCQLLKAFDCEILAYDVYENPKAKELGVTYLPLDEVLKRSDLVTIHTPLLEGTKGMINKEKLALMKPTAFLVNCARGPIVNSNDLAEALEKGVIAGAGLDVFDMEPPIPADYPLLNAKNAILTPHIGFLTNEAMVKRARIAFDNILAFLDGTPQNLIAK